MKRLISKLLTIVMMASIIMNTIYVSANAKEVVTIKVKEKPQYKRIYDFNKQGKEVDNSSKEVKSEIIETEVPAKEVVDSDFNALAQVEDSTSYSNENIVLNTPSELRTIETSDSIVLIWNSVESGKGYELEIDGEIKDCGNKTLFVHSNIKDSNIHKYRVRAKNGELKSEWSSYVEKSKKLEIIDVPKNIINVPTENSVKISWNRVNSASGYDIEVDGVIKDIGKSTNYIHEALEPNTKHTYKVRAKKGDNYGQWSKVITVSTLAKKETTNKDTENKSDKKVVNEKDEKSVVKELKESNTSEVVTQSATQTISSTSMKMLAAATATTEVQVSNTLGVEDVILTLPLNIAVESTNNTLLVHWDKVEGAKSYDIEVDGTIITESIDTFYEHINLLPGTQHTYRVRAKDDTQVSEWSEVITGTTLAEDIIVKSNMTLTSDRTFTSLNLTAGTVSLNGFKLTVVGDLVQSGGTINIAGGSLIIGNNITQTGGTMNINKGKLTVKSNYKITGNSYLSMPDAACYVLVEGDFEISSNYDGYNYLRAGTLEVKGNLTQKSLNYLTSSKCNFRQDVGFVVKLSGGTSQTIDIMDDTSSSFNILDISENPKAIFIKPIRAKEIRGLDKLAIEDMLEIVGTWNPLSNNLVVGGSIKLVSGTINLSGHDLTILGDLTQIDTRINLTGGKLIVGKDHKITGNSSLNMLDAACYVLVEGNFEISSNYDGNSYFKAGTLEVKGNLTQKSLNYNTSSKCNFNQNIGFNVKLNGGIGQTIDIMDDTSSTFNILDISMNPKAIFIKPIRAKEIRGLDKLAIEDVLEVVGTWNPLSHNLVVGGSIKLVGGTINLNGYNFTILGDLTQIDTRLNLTGGKIIVGNDYKIAGNSYINMLDAACYVLVEGDFEISSNYNGYSYFKAGTLEVRGNLTQKSLENSSTDDKYNFRQNVGFVIKLSGKNGQIVNITNYEYCSFNMLDMSESNGVIFLSNIGANKILGWEKISGTNFTIYNSNLTFDRNEIINCNLELLSGSLNLNGYSLVALKNLTQSSNQTKINGGQLIVGQDYIINGNSRLIMTNSNDYVLVTGNFDTKSRSSESGYLSAGILEIKGNLTEGGYNEYSLCQTELFTLKLTGDSIQTVKIVSGASSPFSILDMSLSAGVIISSGIKVFMITGLDKIRNDYSLSLINTNLKLFADTTLSCGLDLNGGSLDLNGNDFNVGGSLSETNSKVILNGGHLNIKENYFIQGSSLLVMQNPYDIVVVGGSFITSSNISESGYLTTGIMILKGDFSQSGNSYSFDASGDHYVVFDGVIMQHVYFEDEGTSKFNEILISNPASIDYSKPEMVNLGTLTWNFLLGIKDAAVGNVEGFLYIFEEPIKTLEGIAYLLSIINPGIEQVKFCIAMQPIIINAACDVVEGNWNYRVRILGRIAGEILFIIAGDKGANIGISLLKESGTIINISRAAKYALKYMRIDKVTKALATGKNVIGAIQTKLDDLIDVAGRAKLSNYTILEEEYLDILDIVLSWNKRNSSSIMTEFEASAMIKAHREGKSFDEILRAIETSYVKSIDIFNNADEWIKSLSNEELQALSKYQTTDIYEAINASLRNGQVDDGLLGIIENLDSAIAKGSINSEIELYRGFTNEDIISNWDDIVKGEKYSSREDGYLSTSLKPSVADNFAMLYEDEGIFAYIKVSNVDGANLNALSSGVMDESEILLERGLKYTITKAWEENGQKYVIMEVSK